jgi:hypothetical protein
MTSAGALTGPFRGTIAYRHRLPRLGRRIQAGHKLTGWGCSARGGLMATTVAAASRSRSISTARSRSRSRSISAAASRSSRSRASRPRASADGPRRGRAAGSSGCCKSPNSPGLANIRSTAADYHGPKQPDPDYDRSGRLGSVTRLGAPALEGRVLANDLGEGLSC